MSQDHRSPILSPRTKRLGFATCLGVMLVCSLLVRTDRLVEAARPGDLARIVPGTPLVLLETEDLPGLVARWRDCEMRAPVEDSESYRACNASRLGLRLSERLGLLDTAMSEPITLDRLASLPGNRGGLALYNVGDTSFVFWLRTHHGAASDLAVLAPDLEVERTERGEHRYMIHRGTEETAAVAFAVVGDLLIFGNALEQFEAAVDLAIAGSGSALMGDPTYEALARRAPESAQVHLYLDMGRLAGTRQFRRYWVHDNAEDLAGVERAMLSVTWEERRTVEHRVLAYREGGRRLAAGATAAPEPGERFAALPRGSYAAIETVDDARGAAALARWLWPSDTEGAPEDLARLLEPARPSQAVEIHRPGMGRDAFSPRDEMAVAFLLADPDALATGDVVDAASAAMTETLSEGRTVEPERRRAPGRGVVATRLAAPLPGSPQLVVSRSRDRTVLVLATSSRLANELARNAAPTAPLGQALRTAGPNVARVNWEGVSTLLRRRLDLITTEDDYDRFGPEAFLGEEVPELLEVPDISTIDRLAWRDGDFDIQEVRFIE